MLEQLISLIENYAAYEYPVAAAQLFLAMLGMGALLTPRSPVALATTPIILKLLESKHPPPDFSMPVGLIARDIVGTLIVPLLLGMLIRSRTTVWYAAQFSKWVIRLSLMLILVIVVGSATSGRLAVGTYGVMGVAALVIFALTIYVCAMLVCKLLDMASGDTLAIGIEATFRNISLAIAVKATVFPAQPGVLDPLGDGVLFAALLYGGVSLFMTLPPIYLHRRLPARASGLTCQIYNRGRAAHDNKSNRSLGKCQHGRDDQ